jgi:hypothetical protein
LDRTRYPAQGSQTALVIHRQTHDHNVGRKATCTLCGYVKTNNISPNAVEAIAAHNTSKFVAID